MKTGCCYLVTWSYYRHARFTSKRYAILGPQDIDSLFSVLGNLDKLPAQYDDAFDYRRSYSGVFVDNRNGNRFDIFFETLQVPSYAGSTKWVPTPAIKKLYDFIETNIPWRETY